MSKYLVAIHRPNGYDPSVEDEAMGRAISALNTAMVAAGVRVFVGGLQPLSTAKSVILLGGDALVTDGPYLKGTEHVGGFWVLECADFDEALMWGRKAAKACKAAVEVRPFH